MTREEQREQEAYAYILSDAVCTENMQLAFGDFINGAKWADKTMIQKAGEWMKEQDMAKYLRLSAGMICVTTFDKELFIKDFLKAMEE